MLDLAWSLSLGAWFGLGGLPGVVTRPAPDDTPIAAPVLWLSLATEDGPNGAELHRRERVRLVAVQKSDVPTMPIRTRIVAAEWPGGPTSAWRVDRVAFDEPDLWRVIVSPDGVPA